MSISVSEPGVAGKKLAVEAADERGIVNFIYHTARLADDRRFMEWVDLFAEECEYSVITNENLNANGLRLCKDSNKRALQERAAYQMAIWQVPRGKILHFVTNTIVTAGGEPDTFEAVSNILVTRTGDMEHTKLHAAGRYHDVIARDGDGWLIKSRLVIVDSNMLPSEFTELL